MNEDVFAGKWRQLRGSIQSWWGDLTDDDLEWVAGQKDRLVGIVQQKYGWTRDQARDEVDLRLDEYQDSGIGEKIDDIKTKAYTIGANSASKASQAASMARDKFENARSYIRDNDFDAMVSDLGGVIRKYPVQFLLLGIGLLYVLSRKRL